MGQVLPKPFMSWPWESTNNRKKINVYPIQLLGQAIKYIADTPTHSPSLQNSGSYGASPYLNAKHAVHTVVPLVGYCSAELRLSLLVGRKVLDS